MRRLKPLIAFLAALIVPLGGMVVAAPALAYNVGQVYKQCEDNGALTGHFSRAELKAALSGLPSEVSEYSDCQDLIQQALVRASSHGGGSNTGSSKAHLAGANGKGGGRNGSGGTGATGNSLTKNGRSTGKGSDNAVSLAGADVRPGSTGSGSASSSVPVPLLIVLILLALTALSGGAVALRRRVDARQST
jgi:cobalamin biosynthesis Mg chelatase CobN